MLEKLRIKNFQSHADSKLTFSPGVNVITGSSDSGKSAIIRAIEWSLRNRPLGGEFVSSFANGKPTIVDLRFESARIIKRRSGSKNVYLVDGKLLEAVRSDVPDEIASVANMPDFSIQSQHNPYFLLSVSPGEVARFINSEIGIDIIDKLYSAIDRNRRSLSSEVGLLSEQRSDTEIKIKSLQDIDRLTGDFEELDRLTSCHSTLDAAINRLEEDLDNAENLLRTRDRLSHFVKLKGRIDDLANDLKAYEEFESYVIDLSDSLAAFKELQELHRSLSNKVKLEPAVSSISEDIENWANLNKYISDLDGRLSELVSKTNEASKLHKHIDDLTDEFIRSLKDAQVCPLCLSPLSNEKLSKLEQQIRSKS